ncbi:MAG: hypothetical protein GXP49_15945 [Deltaproteobacteria bacterium]|nr:hypothetical protein [Deltaproteobacteria bacterium]
MSSRKEWVVLASTLILAAGVAGAIAIFGPKPPKPAPINLPERIFAVSSESEKQSSDQDNRIRSVFKPSEKEEHILELFRRFNIKERGCRLDSRGKELGKAKRDLQAAAVELVKSSGMDRYKALGVFAYCRFADSLDNMLGSDGGPDSGLYKERLLSWGGGFVDAALSAGVLYRDKEQHLILPHKHKFFVRALFLARWAGFLEPRFPMSAALSKADYSAVLKWRAWHSNTTSLEQRIQAIHDLATLDPSFRPRLAAGLVYARLGKTRQAMSELEIEKRLWNSPEVEVAIEYVKELKKLSSKVKNRNH